MIAAHSGQKLDVVEKATDRDNFMSADEAQKFGLIDKVVEAHKTVDKELDKKDKK